MIFNAGTEASGVRNPNHAHTPAPYNGWDERAGMKRKAISKRVRFEVFKRDSFKCQYCGKCAPDVNHAECLRLIKGAVESGYSIESITDFAKTVKTWTAFRDELEGLQNG